MHFDSTDNLVFINEKIHKNAHATTVLLASLCRNVSGTIIRGTLKTPNSQLVTPISTKL
jgi:hypothetical protein